MLEQRAPMTGRVRELHEAIERRRREIDSYKERIGHAHGENDRLHLEIAAARRDADGLVTQIESQTADRALRLESVTARESMLAATRRDISGLVDQRGREEVRGTQITLRMENLHSYALERYRVDLTTFEQDVHLLLTTISAQKASRGRSRRKAALAAPGTDPNADPNANTTDAAAPLAPSEPGATDGFAAADAQGAGDEAAFAEEDCSLTVIIEEEIDWEFVESAVAELRQRLDSMGPVNLDAIQEYEELEERHRFLQGELDDLTKARLELLGIIQRINDETKKRFTETFYQVRDNFRSTFKELFGAGAQADLVLVNEDDPLESGIEVIAKPPGKKPTSITLLSGGERSMTAVALLFSIYMVKPSPFCVLDELDAPLDESNIGRFLKMLDRFIENSQFVIVTHNKRTMRRADVMYGVTMEEFGVSKPVGMKLTETEGRRAAAATEHEAPPSELPADAPAGG
jgi:chromosome segregation protein